ncbi:uncharacterized protein [Ptychodera flava]|uniref:uncharacterized protein n=1 Tax=Ptychodera flava TaxID=63121 RepID=UPI00396A0FB7
MEIMASDGADILLASRLSLHESPIARSEIVQHQAGECNHHYGSPEESILTPTLKLCYSDSSMRESNFKFGHDDDDDDDDDDNDSVASDHAEQRDDRVSSQPSQINNMSLAQEFASCKERLFLETSDVSCTTESTDGECQLSDYSSNSVQGEMNDDRNESRSSKDVNCNVFPIRIFQSEKPEYPETLFIEVEYSTEATQESGMSTITQSTNCSQNGDVIFLENNDTSYMPNSEMSICMDKKNFANDSNSPPRASPTMITSTPLKPASGTFQPGFDSANRSNTKECPVIYFNESPASNVANSPTFQFGAMAKRHLQNRRLMADNRDNGNITSFGITTNCNGLIKRDGEAPFSSFQAAFETALAELKSEHRDRYEIQSMLGNQGFIDELLSSDDEESMQASYKAWCQKRMAVHMSCSVFPSEIAEQGARRVIMDAIYEHINEMTRKSSSSETRSRFSSCKKELIEENAQLKSDIQELKDQKDSLESKLHELREKKFQMLKEWRKANRDIRNACRQVRSLEDQVVTIRELTAQNIKVSTEEIEVSKSASCVVM